MSPICCLHPSVHLNLPYLNPCTVQVHVLLSTELVMHVVPILVCEIGQHGDSTHHNACAFSLPKPRQRTDLGILCGRQWIRLVGWELRKQRGRLRRRPVANAGPRRRGNKAAEAKSSKLRLSGMWLTIQRKLFNNNSK